MTPVRADQDARNDQNARADRDARTGRGVGLASRLFLAVLAVVVAAGGTVLVVAVLFAPALFHTQLQADHLPDLPDAVRTQVDHAFDRALIVALGVGLGVAALAAGAISWLVARRLAASVQDVALAAEHLADGHYDTPVRDPRLGPEFATLAGSMNRLTSRLTATEADRMRLTGELAHQLRTPLASLQATVEALTDGVLAPDPATLAVLSDQTARLYRLVGDLEKVSRAQERQVRLHPSPQALAPVAERCVAAFRGRYQADGVVVRLHLDPATPAVRIDADRLAEVVSNLLDNALRHCPRGAEVTVTVRPDRPSRPRQALLVVTDTGEGFDPAESELLFARFRRGRTAQPATGSGLGLTIARAIVEAHAGTLTATSAGPGHGATFTIALPAVPPG